MMCLANNNNNDNYNNNNNKTESGKDESTRQLFVLSGFIWRKS